MLTADFDYHLPPELIAQEPVEPRDSSRLLVLNRADGSLRHLVFRDLPSQLRPGDLLVANATRVLPARLFGRKSSGGRVELLLLRQLDPDVWEALVRPARRLPPGTRVRLEPLPGRQPPPLAAQVLERLPDGARRVRLDGEELPPAALLPEYGAMPLPPYIHHELADPERYQTVYSRVESSAAAPTAGLHFTPNLMRSVEALGARFVFVRLDVGLDTFRPVAEERVEDHAMHSEYCELNDEVVAAVAETRRRGGRVVAVGTTAVRVLETAARGEGGQVQAFCGRTTLFCYPGFQFMVVDALITNFHLPRSTLIMLVSAFAGRARVLAAYAEATRRRYRFYSFGDAMFIE